jgi:predicted O-methyltransferase YrrM
VDTIDYNAPPSYHIENVCAKKQSAACEALVMKQKALSAMGRLEGWCTREKALVLIDLLLEIRPQVVLEVGVFGGKSLIPMAFALQFNRKGKIIGIDPWDSQKSIEGQTIEHAEWWLSIDHEAILQDLINKISEHKLGNYIELIRSTSIDATIKTREIDVLHIDGNHSDQTSYIDVTKWVPYVKKGGLIIFDDLDWASTARAIRWLDDHCIRVTEFRGENVWAIWVKP